LIQGDFLEGLEGTFPVKATFRSKLVLILSIFASAVQIGFSLPNPAPSISTKQRLIVLTDIGAEVDDTESMVRLLLYSNNIDVEGLIATTSTWKRTTTSPDLIQKVISAYAKVHPNLLKHDASYPSAKQLHLLVKSGIATYGMTGVGNGKDSEGSDWIIRALDKHDPRPLWVVAWGGANTLAQALFKLKETRSQAEVDRLVAKLRVYTISDQDDSGPWMRKTFPNLFFIVTPGGNYSAATWTGINAVVQDIDNTTISNKWLVEHIQEKHGPLGTEYPDVAYGMEGDTPSWLALIPNGLSEPEHPNWGGWGGRYELYQPEVSVSDPRIFIGGVPIEQETRPIWTNATDDYVPPTSAEYGRAAKTGSRSFKDFKATLWRWRDDFQNDFAARMDWTIRPYTEANHPLTITLSQPASISVKSGEEFSLGATASDPDGDSVSYYWFQYQEAGSHKGSVSINAENMPYVTLFAPKVDKAETIHFILRVTDKGTPALSRYKRVVVTVVPKLRESSSYRFHMELRLSMPDKVLADFT
jgi:hypothetical protein